MAKKLFVSLIADTEDNYPNYVPGWEKYGSNYDTNPADIRFEWIEYWDELIKIFRSYEFPITWYLHVSPCMKDLLLKKIKQKIYKLIEEGDDVGIHIHTFEWNEKRNKWVQSRNAENEIFAVKFSINLFKKTLGFLPKTSRMGWNFMSNEVMKTLEEEGILCDVSAIPQYYSNGMYGERDNIMDWKFSESEPYYPTYGNYQKKGNMKILEIPISSLERKATFFNSFFFTEFSKMKFFKFFNIGIIRKISEIFDFSPHTNFTISPIWSISHAKKIVDNYTKKAHNEGEAYLVGYFHPSDIFDPKNGKLNENFKRKVEKILDYINSKSKEVEIVRTTIPKLYEELMKGRKK